MAQQPGKDKDQSRAYKQPAKSAKNESSSTSFQPGTFKQKRITTTTSSSLQPNAAFKQRITTTTSSLQRNDINRDGMDNESASDMEFGKNDSNKNKNKNNVRYPPIPTTSSKSTTVPTSATAPSSSASNTSSMAGYPPHLFYDNDNNDNKNNDNNDKKIMMKIRMMNKKRDIQRWHNMPLHQMNGIKN